MEKKKYRHIIIEALLLFASFFVILISVNAYYTYDASFTEAWESEVDTAYTRSYVVAHYLSHYGDDYEQLMEKLNEANENQKATLMGPLVLSECEDGSIELLYNLDSKIPFEPGQKLRVDKLQFSDLKQAEKGNYTRAAENTKQISSEDGLTKYWAVLYPVEEDPLISATLIDAEYLRKMSFKSSRKLIINNAVISALLCMVLIVLMNGKILLPLRKLHDGLRKYVDDLNTDELVSSMGRINSANEIGRLAVDISDLGQRIHRYSEENTKMVREQTKLASELELAADIQSSVLPVDFPDRSVERRFELFASMKTAKEVGGDFYDFFMIDDDHIALVIADASDKGVPAALFMMNSKTLLHNRLMEGDSPAVAMSSINRQLCEHNDAFMFITVWAAIIEISTGKVVSTNAGHENPAIMKSKDMKWKLIKVPHDPMVAVKSYLEFNENEYALDHGDCLFVYTDGVTESRDKNGGFYGEERLIKALDSSAENDPESLIATVSESISRFSEETAQFDDITMLCFKLV